MGSRSEAAGEGGPLGEPLVIAVTAGVAAPSTIVAAGIAVVFLATT